MEYSNVCNALETIRIMTGYVFYFQAATVQSFTAKSYLMLDLGGFEEKTIAKVGDRYHQLIDQGPVRLSVSDINPAFYKSPEMHDHSYKVVVLEGLGMDDYVKQFFAFFVYYAIAYSLKVNNNGVSMIDDPFFGEYPSITIHAPNPWLFGTLVVGLQPDIYKLKSEDDGCRVTMSKIGRLDLIIRQ